MSEPNQNLLSAHDRFRYVTGITLNDVTIVWYNGRTWINCFVVFRVSLVEGAGSERSVPFFPFIHQADYRCCKQAANQCARQPSAERPSILTPLTTRSARRCDGSAFMPFTYGASWFYYLAKIPVTLVRYRFNYFATHLHEKLSVDQNHERHRSVPKPIKW